MSYRQRLDRVLLQYSHAKATAKREREALQQVQDQLTDIETAQLVIQSVAKQVQERAHSQIAAVVSRCLSAVFNQPYEFRIEFVRKRGRTEAILQFVRDGEVYDEPLDETGGGVVDVAAFALRLAAVLLSRPRLRKILIMDEPFKHLSRQYSKRVCELLNKLSEELDVQFIMVTHNKRLMTGLVYKVNGDGSVEKLQG